jgi:hypothetical protein
LNPLSMGGPSLDWTKFAAGGVTSAEQALSAG